MLVTEEAILWFLYENILLYNCLSDTFDWFICLKIDQCWFQLVMIKFKEYKKMTVNVIENFKLYSDETRSYYLLDIKLNYLLHLSCVLEPISLFPTNKKNKPLHRNNFKTRKHDFINFSNAPHCCHAMESWTSLDTSLRNWSTPITKYLPRLRRSSPGSLTLSIKFPASPWNFFHYKFKTV